VVLLRTDVSEDLCASIIRVTRIGELGTLSVTSNRRTLRRKINLLRNVGCCKSHSAQHPRRRHSSFFKRFLSFTFMYQIIRLLLLSPLIPLILISVVCTMALSLIYRQMAVNHRDIIVTSLKIFPRSFLNQPQTANSVAISPQANSTD
jgi:lipopolysaccharide/colanic/teichoic acid biosynthesis glycosyltransferase